MTLRVSPFGMDTCCVCGKPTTHAVITRETWGLAGSRRGNRDGEREVIPYCADCANAEKQAFPEIKVYSWNPATVRFRR